MVVDGVNEGLDKDDCFAFYIVVKPGFECLVGESGNGAAGERGRQRFGKGGGKTGMAGAGKNEHGFQISRLKG